MTFEPRCDVQVVYRPRPANNQHSTSEKTSKTQSEKAVKQEVENNTAGRIAQVQGVLLRRQAQPEGGIVSVAGGGFV